ncbi:helix-turn-helix domain-containing protein [Streptomyces sp. NBC_00347]|uniref:helix-turn-helix domain-containing protein n=1 Tax=Streptomyces sp. NBC_00347 TaxID=2975721 RepID=UPI00225672EE|nr:helix-turn-helix domain-containing protein [Streptomyces sp. NBC_00347]MCX5123542.1 helix-turn-helix domain-containing protein [Streptomyces sp. NBC_00347]MCX5405635.1 helix-turn-helix domain-containing protein [Streptomyces sp. NBC_00086]
MTKRTPHGDPTLPRLFGPEELARALGCSAWWVRDRARRRLIPFVYVGGAYRFTADHLAEIIRIHEERPATAAPSTEAPAPPRKPASVQARSAGRSGTSESRPRLVARPPRRLLNAQARYETAA